MVVRRTTVEAEWAARAPTARNWLRLPDDYIQPDMTPKQNRAGFKMRTGKGSMAGPDDTAIGYGKGMGHRLQYAVSRIQALGARGRHLDAADRPLARRDHAQRANWKTRPAI